MNNQNQNGKGIFYGVIGVATLVVAVIGATFAYFTATQSNNLVITGNAASIQFNLKVERAETTDIAQGGLIPMSNSMVHEAVSKNVTCVDDNGNSVCQIYKITVDNTSSASMLLDGYVTLANDVGGPLGTPTDVTYANSAAATTMRWAQVFSADGGKYTTAGKTTTTATAAAPTTPGFTNSTSDWANISLPTASETGSDTDGKNLTNIYGGTSGLVDGASITAQGSIKGNTYDIINKNYIRISDHNPSAAYTRTADLTSALVFNQYLDAASGTSTTDSVVLYIVVWLSETGTNQTPDAEDSTTNRGTGVDFFQGTVTFLSAQGGEVTATFSNYATVAPTDTAGAATTTQA